MKDTDIEIGSIWQDKNGRRYKIFSTITYYSCDGADKRIKEGTPCVWYEDKQSKISVKTEVDFLKDFTPYEPEYKYQYAFKFRSKTDFNAVTGHLTDKEAAELIASLPELCYQKIEASKIEA